MILNGGFESGLTFWAPEGSAYISAEPGVGGSACLQLYAAWSPNPALRTQGSVVQAFSTIPGFSYPVRLWTNPDDAGGRAKLSVWVDRYGNGNYNDFIHERARADFPVSGWQLWEVGEFTAGGNAAALLIGNFQKWGPIVDAGSYLVDDVSVAAEAGIMAIMLGEYDLRLVAARLQSALNTEIGYVNAERGDSLGLPAVDRWYAYRRPEPLPDGVECCIFIDGPLTFPLFSSEMTAWRDGVRVRMSHKSVVVVRLTHVPRTSPLKASEVEARLMRYAAAIVRTIRNQPTLGADGLTVQPLTVDYHLAGSIGTDTNPRIADTVECRFELQVQESPAGETQASGGIPPACVLES